MTLDRSRSGELLHQRPEQPLAGQSLHELYEEAHTPWEWHAPIMERARELGMICFSTPFDETAVDFLEDLGLPLLQDRLVREHRSAADPQGRRHRQAHDHLHRHGHRRRARRGGAHRARSRVPRSRPAQVHQHLPGHPREQPTSRTIPHLRELFGCEVGLSDHTMGIGVAVAAVALGATVIEKHFTLRRADGGVDSAFSMEPAEMLAARDGDRARLAGPGRGPLRPDRGGEGVAAFRRSIYIAADIKAGEVLTPENLRIVRPGFGLAPKHYESLLGRRVNRALPVGTAMDWTYV